VDFAGVGLSLAALIAAVAALHGGLSNDAALADAGEPAPAASGTAREPLPALRGERRAIVVLMLGQLRGDLTTQLGVATNVVVASLMMAFWMMTDGIGEPSMALMLLPIGIRDVFLRTREPDATWPFLSAPADRSRLVIAFRDGVAAIALVPAMIVLAALQLYRTGPTFGAAAVLISSGMAAYVMLQLGALASPALPLSASMTRVQPRVLTGMPVMIAGMLLAVGIRLALYSGRAGASATVVLAGALIPLLNRLTRWRVARARPA
jgi:hypothetical protein